MLSCDRTFNMITKENFLPRLVLNAAKTFEKIRENDQKKPKKAIFTPAPKERLYTMKQSKYYASMIWLEVHLSGDFRVSQSQTTSTRIPAKFAIFIILSKMVILLMCFFGDDWFSNDKRQHVLLKKLKFFLFKSKVTDYFGLLRLSKSNIFWPVVFFVNAV